jgi:sortase A
MRGSLRALSTVLIVAGTLMLLDAALTIVWQEPVSAVYAQIVQGRRPRPAATRRPERT